MRHDNLTRGSSIRFNDSINIIDEFEGAIEPNKTEHQEEGKGHERGVAKKIRGLQPSGHVRPFVKEEKGVGEDEQAGSAAIA